MLLILIKNDWCSKFANCGNDYQKPLCAMNDCFLEIVGGSVNLQRVDSE